MAKSKLINTKPAAFAKGGSTKMFGKQHAGPRASLSKSGTAQVNASDGGKFAKGGSTHMFGKQSASPRKSGQTGK